MKQVKFYLFAILGLAVFFSACKKDSTNDPIVVDGTTYKQGTTVFTVDKVAATVTIKDLGEGFGGNYTMAADTLYILDGLVFVNEGQVLTIDAGTMIQGKPGQGENASALIVARGGKIMAEGTASAPIVFTGLGDNYEGSTYGPGVRGLWGGLIILGKASNSNLVDKHIEGIPETEVRGVYGNIAAPDDADNSGVLKYISVRHGGTDIGAGNEINGITLGSVGSGTVIDYVEVYATIDDGIEFFGGAPNVKHFAVFGGGDDGFDYDEGFHGKGQFWFVMQDDVAGDKCAEQDGGPSDNEIGQPYAIPTIANATYMSNGGELMCFRDNAGGHYYNSIFNGAGKGAGIEWRNDKGGCSYDMFTAGKLTIENCIFSKVAGKPIYSYNEVNTVVLPSTNQPDLDAYFTSAKNTVNDAIFASGAYIPATGANSVATISDAWFTTVNYQGAFDPNGANWMSGWTVYMSGK
jgi:hypothetical protein